MELEVNVADVLDTDVVKQAYDDIIQPAAAETGKTLGKIPRYINALLAPLDIWAIKQETKTIIAEKLKMSIASLNESDFIESKNYISAPIVNALSYTAMEEPLCDMFVNMLASSMKVNTAQYVHPAYIEILKQMSPLDAKLLKHIYSSDHHVPVIQYYFGEEHLTEHLKLSSGFTGFKLVENAIYYPDETEYPLVQFAINNLCRLGLIEIQKAPLHDKSSYSKVDNLFRPQLESMIATYYTHPDYSNYKIILRYENIEQTPIGTSLCKISLLDAGG